MLNTNPRNRKIIKPATFLGMAFVLVFLPSDIRAAENIFVSRGENVIKITGTCSSNVLVTLVEQDSGRAVYTAGASCQDKKFSFSDDLLKWNLPDGKYLLTVDGHKTGKLINRKESMIAIQEKNGGEEISQNAENQATTDASSTEVSSETAKANSEATGESDVPAETISANSSPDLDTAPETNFLGAFAAFQQASLDMRTWLMKTKYPELIKKSIDATLDGVDMAVGKITDLLWSAVNDETENIQDISEEKSEEEASAEEATSLEEEIEEQ